MSAFETSKPVESHAETLPSHDKKQEGERLASLADRVRGALAIPDKMPSPEVSTVWKSLERDHAFDPEGFYRIVNQDGYDDFVESGIVRSKVQDTEGKGVLELISRRPTSFPSFAKGLPDLSYAKEGEDNYIFESNLPMYSRGDQNPATGKAIASAHWAYRPIDPVTGEVMLNLQAKDVKKIYKIDKDGGLFLKS